VRRPSLITVRSKFVSGRKSPLLGARLALLFGVIAVWVDRGVD
jgi:hypothetical protein